MNVLIIGGGGREHALAWKCAASPRVSSVLVAPGNAGTEAEPGCENVAVKADDIDGLLALAVERSVGLTIVGPEAPLVAGVVDRFQDAGLRIFGPSAQAARLEGSKDFSKAFLTRHDIATAGYCSFTDVDEAIAWVKQRGAPLVVKADGLAAGKGVTVASSVDEAIECVRACLSGNVFGAAGHKVVVEEYLEGEEASFICMVAGEQVLALASSQDHKARDEGDEGPNTGGMGAYSPAPVVDAPMHQRIMQQVIHPTVRALAAEGIPYLGFLYVGLMIGSDGVPRVLEFNCRFGDPETQPILMRMNSDLVAVCEAAIDGSLDKMSIEWDKRVALAVVMAAGGYPFDYAKGDVIRGLGADVRDCKVFHAGTARSNADIVTAGGRVLSVCALGRGVADARSIAYQRVREIKWNNVQYRRDIGYRALAREMQAK